MILKSVLELIVLSVPVCLSLNASVPDVRLDFLYHAVIPIEGLERLYLNTKPPLEHWKVRYPDDKSPELRQKRREVCWTVVTSEQFLDAYKVYPISKANKLNLVCHSEKSSTNVSTNATSLSYRKREVWIEKRSVKELVFPCLACSYETGEVVEFFISQAYNGQTRFVFKYNDEGKLVAVAMAELSPKVVRHDVQGFSSESLQADDSRSICDTNAAERVRLCAVMLNSLLYRNTDKVRFIPSRDKNPPCEERVIEFQRQTGNTWAVPCVAVKTETNALERYYISNQKGLYRGYYISKDGNSPTLDMAALD